MYKLIALINGIYDVIEDSSTIFNVSKINTYSKLTPPGFSRRDLQSPGREDPADYMRAAAS